METFSTLPTLYLGMQTELTNAFLNVKPLYSYEVCEELSKFIFNAE